MTHDHLPATERTSAVALTERHETCPVRASLQVPGVLLLALGCLIGAMVRNGQPIPGFDLHTLEAISRHRNGSIVEVSRFVDFWDGPKASPWLMMAALVVIFAVGHRLLAILTVLMTALAWTPGHFAKYLFPRDRPPASTHPLIVMTGPNSFPSGHTGIISAAVVAGAFAFTMLDRPRARRWWIVIGIPLVLVVALSRLVVAVRYPTDVLGGAVLALGIALVVWPPFAWLYATVGRRWPWWVKAAEKR